MLDYFALLDESRRPWLEPDALKQKFLTRSSEFHPDRVHGADAATKSLAQQRYTEFNAAYLCLREPRDRLRHLLELETGCKPGELQEMPAELADLFMELASAYRQTDTFLARYTNLTSPLLRVQCFAEVRALTEKLTALQQRIKARSDQLLLALQELDRRWVASDSAPASRTAMMAELETICRGLGFFARWNGQLQERLFRLML